jgi:hypothetical protein
VTLKCTELSAERYFNDDDDTTVFSLRTNGAEFTVMDVEKVIIKNTNESYLTSVSNQFIQDLRTVEVMKSDGDFTLYRTKCHLGKSLAIGSTVLGFDLTV